MTYPFQKIAILGLGLLGGSLALDLKAQGLAEKVLGYNRSPKNRRLASKRGACDEIFASAKEAVQQADLVVLATPVDTMEDLVMDIANKLKPGALLTDLGSTKASLNQKIPKLLPKHAYFLGGHPMAGSHETGMEAARTGLFREKFWFLCPLEAQKKKSGFVSTQKKLEKLIRALGSKVVYIKASQHDKALANISHLPQMVSYALMNSQKKSTDQAALQWAGSGFKDLSRLSASSPAMWLAIAKENKKSLVYALNKFQKSLEKLKNYLEKDQYGPLEKYFKEASSLRKNLSK